MSPASNFVPDPTSNARLRDREEIQFLTELAYNLQQQNRSSLMRMSILMSRASGIAISTEQLDTCFGISHATCSQVKLPRSD